MIFYPEYRKFIPSGMTEITANKIFNSFNLITNVSKHKDSHLVISGNTEQDICHQSYYYDKNGNEFTDNRFEHNMGDLSNQPNMQNLKVSGFDLYSGKFTDKKTVIFRDTKITVIDQSYDLEFLGNYKFYDKELLHFRANVYSPNDTQKNSILVDANGFRPIYRAAIAHSVYKTGIIIQKCTDDNYALYDYTTNSAVPLIWEATKIHYNPKENVVRYSQNNYKIVTESISDLRKQYDKKSCNHVIIAEIKNGLKITNKYIKKNPPIFTR